MLIKKSLTKIKLDELRSVVSWHVLRGQIHIKCKADLRTELPITWLIQKMHEILGELELHQIVKRLKTQKLWFI